MNNPKIEITFLNVLEGKDFPVYMDSDSSALSMAAVIKAMTDHGHIVSGVRFTNDEPVTYDDPIEMLMNMTDPGEIRTVEDATKILSEAEANGWHLAPDITPAVLMEIYNDMEPEKEE